MRNQMEQQFYEQIKHILSEARNKVYQMQTLPWWKHTGI